MTTTFPGGELHQNPGRAKRATKNGPVFLAKRGRATHVLLAFDEYQRLAARQKSMHGAVASQVAAQASLDRPIVDEDLADGRIASKKPRSGE